MLCLPLDEFLYLGHAPAALGAAIMGVEHIAGPPSAGRNCFSDRFFAYSVTIADKHQVSPIFASESHSYLD
jgi:hypothetical protein